MIRLRSLSPQEIREHLASHEFAFSYLEVGATADLESRTESLRSSGYDVDLRQFPLGRGRSVFEQARSALRSWRHLEIPWLHFYGSDHAAFPDQLVATAISVFGIQFINPCRVIYFDEFSNAIRLAYGTLTGHAECGEERFSVSIDPSTEIVNYEIASFSRPDAFLARAGYPIVRRLQRRFAVASADALKQACA